LFLLVIYRTSFHGMISAITGDTTLHVLYASALNMFRFSQFPKFPKGTESPESPESPGASDSSPQSGAGASLSPSWTGKHVTITINNGLHSTVIYSIHTVPDPWNTSARRWFLIVSIFFDRLKENCLSLHLWFHLFLLYCPGSWQKLLFAPVWHFLRSFDGFLRPLWAGIWYKFWCQSAVRKVLRITKKCYCRQLSIYRCNE